jgi:hypothetical protein
MVPQIHWGECDASFTKKHKEDVNGMASMCSTTWMGTCDLTSCIVMKDYICFNSIEAEVVGMYLLLNDAYRLSLNIMNIHLKRALIVFIYY